MSDLKFSNKHICWDCQEYTILYKYGINGLCPPCLRKREIGFASPSDDKNKILITMKAKAYIDHLSKNDHTSPTYNPELNAVVAEDLASKHDRIDNCKKYDFTFLKKYMSKKNVGS